MTWSGRRQGSNWLGRREFDLNLMVEPCVVEKRVCGEENVEGTFVGCGEREEAGKGRMLGNGTATFFLMNVPPTKKLRKELCDVI